MSIDLTRLPSLYALTGLSHSQALGVISRLWEIHPDSGRGRPWSLSFSQRVLLCLTRLRTNLTEEQLAVLFSTTDSTVDRVIQDLIPALASLLDQSLPSDRRTLLLVDGTLIPTEDRGGNHSKNYRRSVNLQVVTEARSKKVLFVGTPLPGSRHDSPAFDLSGAGEFCEDRPLRADAAYRKQGREIRTPHVKPRGGKLSAPEERRNAYHRKRRARIEHVFSVMKRVWVVLRNCRRRGGRVREDAQAVAFLYNLRLGY